MTSKNRYEVLNSVEKGHNVFAEPDSKERRVLTDRRPLLKGLLISVGSVLGFGRTVNADVGSKRTEIQEKAEAAMDGYRTTAGVDTALTKHGNGLLPELISHGYLESTAAEDLLTGDVTVLAAPSEADPKEGTYVTASEQKGEFVAHISIVKKTPMYVIRINIKPQLNRSFATIKTIDGDLVTILNPNAATSSTKRVDTTDDDISLQKSCGTDGYTCPPSVCCNGCLANTKYERICCVYSDGSTDCYTEPTGYCCQ